MSYILDALRKAERQRRPAKIPTLQTVHQAASASRHRLWPWIGALVVLVNAAVLIWILRPVPTTPVVKSADRATATPAPPASAALSGQAAPATPVEQVPRASPPESPAAVRAGLPQTAASSSQAPVSSRPEPQRKLAPTIERLEPKPGHAAAVAPAGPRAETQKPKPPDGLAPPTSPPTPKAPAAAAPDKPTAPPVTPNPTTPAERGSGSPSAPQDPAIQEVMSKMRLQVLVYSDVPAERLVFINNQKYLEGQSIDGKVVVERITPEGAVLSYQSKRFVLPAYGEARP